jgi:hypothetical protein
MAEKSSWDQANRQQKHGLVWRNRKKICQIIKDYFYLPFFLFIILCFQPAPVYFRVEPVDCEIFINFYTILFFMLITLGVFSLESKKVMLVPDIT